MSNSVDLLEEIAALKAILIASETRNRVRMNGSKAWKSWSPPSSMQLLGVGRKKSDPDQFELALEDLEMAIAVIHAEEDAEDRAAKRPAKPRAANRGLLPKHLPRGEEVIEPESLIWMPFWRISRPTRRWPTRIPNSFNSSVIRGRP